MCARDEHNHLIRWTLYLKSQANLLASWRCSFLFAKMRLRITYPWGLWWEFSGITSENRRSVWPTYLKKERERETRKEADGANVLSARNLMQVTVTLGTTVLSFCSSQNVR